MLRLVVLLALTVLALAAAAARAAAPSGWIASVQSADYRVVVSARRASGGAAPTATVWVQAYADRGGRWQRVVLRRVPGTYFWKTVTAPHALCRLQLGAHAVTVQLLESPSIGCAPARTVSLPTG